MSDVAIAGGPASATFTFVLVHGAFHSAASWTELCEALVRLGAVAVTVDLPGHGADPSPLGGLREDAALVTGMVESVVAHDCGPTILVGHSYGGAVIGQAVTEKSGISACVFLAGFALAIHESIIDGTKGSGAQPSLPLELVTVDDDIAEIQPRSARAIFYDDCTPSEISVALSRLGPQRLSALSEAPTRDLWRHLPSCYVVCANDRAFDPRAQRHLARRTDIRREIRSGHSPFVSRPDELAELLVSIAADLLPPSGSNRRPSAKSAR